MAIATRANTVRTFHVASHVIVRIRTTLYEQQAYVPLQVYLKVRLLSQCHQNFSPQLTGDPMQWSGDRDRGASAEGTVRTLFLKAGSRFVAEQTRPCRQAN
jgi:hypothetical protein